MRKADIELNIEGMTCISCQNKVEKAIKKVKGVLGATVDYRTGVAKITYDKDKADFALLRKFVEDAGYTIADDLADNRSKVVNAASYIAIILLSFFIINRLGILNYLVPSQLADSSLGYGMLFVVGLLTSVHCVAMCGGINLSQSIPNKRNSQRTMDSYLPTILYNFGRLASYTIIGFILGGLGLIIGGGNPSVPTPLQGGLKLIAGIFMVGMAINMLGIIPQFRRLSLPIFGKISRGLYKVLGGKKSPFIVGLLNGLMPCGPLQSMWIVALVAGNPFAGALSMFAFALGTLPLMLGLGSLVAMLGRRFAKLVTKFGAVVVAVLGLAMLSQGAALSGISFDKAAATVAQAPEIIQIEDEPIESAANDENSLVEDKDTVEDIEESSEDVISDDGVQYIESTLQLGRYPEITVEKDVPVRWTINAPRGTINGCNQVMVIPGLNIEYQLVEGENVIEFTPTESGDIPYTCWMGMVRGNINVKG